MGAKTELFEPHNSDLGGVNTEIQRGALRTARTVFVRRMYRPMYGFMCDVIYRVCAVVYTVHRAA
jgi:hypothetical protein